MEEKIIQITSGKGPEECERVVFLVFGKLYAEALKSGFSIELIEKICGKKKDTFLSVLLKIKGDALAPFCHAWEGPVQWIAQSPYRKFHKRKNWFVSIAVYDRKELEKWDEKDFVFQTLRSSGPGGQHVNKVESAVRATHPPTGISVTASGERSQIMNKKEAINLLKHKLLSRQLSENNLKIQEQWMTHNSIERGNANRVYKATLG